VIASLSVTAFAGSTSTYDYGNLYTEVDEMLDVALLQYPIATLRSYAKEGKLSDQFLKLPMTFAQMDLLIHKNIESIKEEFTEDDQLALDAIEATMKRQSVGDRATILEFNDEEANKELVYSVMVDPSRERIIVGFRGSVTPKDFLVDASAWFKRIPNRMRRFDKKQPRYVKMHAGFHKYLFRDTDITADEKERLLSVNPEALDLIEDEEISKFDEILQFHVLPKLREYPGYQLYVTGHSLGAALATLFAFRAASIENADIPKPVSCVSVASPYVGDKKYRKAFNLAEKMGLIRHLRLSNHKDAVTIVPFVSLRALFWKDSPSVGTLYKHVGVNLKLFKDPKKGYKISYPTGPATELVRAWSQSFLTNLAGIRTYLTNHGNLEYNDRLEQSKAELEQMTINGLYEKYLK